MAEMEHQMSPSELTTWRRGHAMSQRDLAVSLNISERTVVRWENNQSPIPSDLPLKLQNIKTTFAKVADTPEQTPDIVTNVCMPGVPPHKNVLPMLAADWERHCLRALAATYVPGIGMVDNLPGGFGPACSPWFYIKGVPPDFVTGNVEAIRDRQKRGIGPDELLLELQALPRWPLVASYRY